MYERKLQTLDKKQIITKLQNENKSCLNYRSLPFVVNTTDIFNQLDFMRRLRQTKLISSDQKDTELTF